MAASCKEMLATGVWRDGRRHRLAELRALDMAERGELLDLAAGALPAERVSALLERALVAVGEVTSIGADEVRAMTIGDRDRLVLALRRLLHGEKLEAVFRCGCGETLELELEVGALLGDDPPAMPAELGAVTGQGVAIRVKAATGADHERAARRALTDVRAASAELLGACLIAARGPDGEAVALTREAADYAEALLAELDPGAELLLTGQCPACGEQVTVPFDPISHLWAELEQRRAQLEYEIHVLALNYHWSEPDILALSPSRRARYLAQLDREFAVR